MNVRAAILSLTCGLALCAPVAASADPIYNYNQGQWLYGTPQQQQFFGAVGSVVTDQGQRATIRQIINDGYRNGQTDRQIDDSVIASLSPAQRVQLRSQLGWGGAAGMNNGYMNGNVRTVRSITNGAITFENGRTAFLRDSTTFEPNRNAIVPGARIVVTGDAIANGNMNATDVQLYNGNNGYNGQGYNGQSASNYYGVITNVTKGDISLANGRTIFTHDGTNYNPNRDALHAGEEVSVRGTFVQNGNLNADEVDVVNFDQNGGYYNNGGWYDSYQNGSYLGIVQSVNKGDITLRNGHTAFLHDGTTINPSGSLQPGMSIAIHGTPTANGNINADRIDVINTPTNWDWFNNTPGRRYF